MSSDSIDLVADVRKVAKTLEEQKAELTSFRKSVQEHIEQVDEMEDNERTAFYENADRLRARVQTADQVDDLLELEEEVEEAIRSPLRQIALESYEEFLSIVNPDIRKDSQNEIEEKISNQIAADLESTADGYQALNERTSELPIHLKELVATFVEENTSSLQDPEEEIANWVDRLEKRHELLQEVDSLFKEAGTWAPETEFAKADAPYGMDTLSISPDTIRTRIDAIDSEVNDLVDLGLDVREIVTDQIQDEIDEKGIAKFATSLRDIETSLTTISGKYEYVSSQIDAMDEFGMDAGLFEEEMDELASRHIQLKHQHFPSLDEIRATVVDLEDDVEEFVSTVHNRLKAQKDLIEVLEDGDEPAPQVHVGGDDDKHTLFRNDVKDELSTALEDCKAQSEWIRNHLDTSEGPIDEDEMVDIWITLSEGDKVELTGENQDAILAMNDYLSLNVVLGSE